MKKAAIRLIVGSGLVGIGTTPVLLIGGDWRLFVPLNGALALLIIVVARGSVLGADKRRPPGVARASAELWAGPLDPNELAARESALQPDDGAAGAEAEEASSGFRLLFVAVPPGAAAIIGLLAAS